MRSMEKEQGRMKHMNECWGAWMMAGCIACGAGWTGGEEAAPVRTEPAAASQTAFALDLYGQLKTEAGNLFFSPYSIGVALTMTYGGARGETATEMARTLHLGARGQDVHADLAALAATLASAQRDEAVALHVANALWPHKTYAFRDEYLDLLQSRYDATATAVDYRQAPEEARQTINDWVEKQTREKITDLFAPGSLRPLTRLVLVNAIYFKGDWARPFDAARTTDAPFTVASDQTVTAPMMAQTARFPYAETESLQVLEMPYAGGEFSMLILLPRAGVELRAIESAFSVAQLEAWIGKLDTRRVEVHVPRFKLEWGPHSLIDPLQALGLRKVFEEGAADLSGMDGTRDLFVNQVVHKAFVDVGEEGTEAAAATGIGIGITAVEPDPRVFRADRPFLFLIREKSTGSLLFIGRLANPLEPEG